VSAAPPPTKGESAGPALDPATVSALQERLLAWYADNGRDLPWRHTRDPYAILVSEVMLQQTQVSRVIPTYEVFLGRFPTLSALAAAPLPEVLRLWLGLGYNNRAERLWRCARTAGGRLPADVAGLQRLPGVGPYTARAVLVFAHNADLAAVDANVRRVLTHELGLPHDLGRSGLQAIADAVLPRGRARDWHNALMDHGALVLTGSVTGLAPITRQSPFAGSRRMYRARLLRLLVETGPQPRASLPRLLGRPPAACADIVAALERDGLVERSDDTVRLRDASVAGPRRRGTKKKQCR
jgi:A/G-specific adenine glycosylase